MGDFDISFQRELARESWSLYSVGMFLILLRIYARVSRLGIKGLQIDDYIMTVAAGLYTALIICLNVISQGGGSNLYPPEDFVTFTPDQIQDRIHGSKIVVVSEQAMLNVIYCIKSCMLIMYSRLTLGLKEQFAVKVLAIYVACGWVGTELAFFFACRPFAGYWAMPPPNPQCTTLQHYAITQGSFNISSDCLMLLIPLPLLIRMNVPWKQKIVLVIIFSLGIFVILAAILTKVFNLSNIWDPSYMLWYTREASVAVYVSNLPMIWPLLRQWFPFLRTLNPGNRRTTSTPRRYGIPTSNSNFNSNNNEGGYAGGSTTGRMAKAGFVKRMSDGMVTTMGKSVRSTSHMDELDSGDELDFMHSKGSREEINKVDDGASSPTDWSRDRSVGGITKSTTVHVREERTGVPPFDFGVKDVEKGGVVAHVHAKKWDWENDGGNAYTAGATTANPGDREGRPSLGGRRGSAENVPQRMRSLSRPGATVAGENALAAPRAAFQRRDTDDKQLSRV